MSNGRSDRVSAGILSLEVAPRSDVAQGGVRAALRFFDAADESK
jgi:hypothetical protein